MNCEIFDPIANFKEAKKIHNLDLKNKLPQNKLYDVVIAAVAHENFKNITINNWKKITKDNSIFFDLNGFIPRELNPLRI